MNSPRSVQGYLLLFSASVCFSLMSTFVRVVGREHAVESAFLRFTVGLAVIAMVWSAGRARLKPVNLRWLAVRGIMGGSAVYCLYYSIGALGLAQGSILFFSYPIFTAIFAHLFLRERLSAGGWLAILAAFVGVYLITRPDDWSGPVGYKLVAIGGAAMAGIAIAAVRECRKTDSSYTIFASLCTFGMIVVAIRGTQTGFTVHFAPMAWAALLGVGFFGTIGQLMMTFAYKFVQASSGCIYSFVTPVLNVALGAALFHERLPMRGWIGACLVVGACLYISLPKGSPAAGAS